MARDRASSSDKLLEMIRGKKKEQSTTGSAPAQGGKGSPAGPGGTKAAGRGAAKSAAGGKLPKLSGASFGGGGKAVVVGVDLGPDCLRMAKTAGAVGKRRLLGFKRVPYEPGAPPGSAGFINFLRDKLRDFCKGDGKVELWTLISSAKVELWNILIPKVPRKQIMDAVFWSVKKEKPFEEGEFLLDFDVLGEVAEKGVPKLSVTVYLVPRKQVEEVTELFTKAGHKLHGITIAPIALQTLFRTRWLQTGAKTYANLYVGRNWSRIDIFHQGNLMLSRGIKAGTTSMVESLMESYGPAQGGTSAMHTMVLQDEPVISMSMDDDEPLIIEDIPSETVQGRVTSGRRMDMEQARAVLVGKLLGGSIPPGTPGEELAEADVVELVLPAAERLVRQIERTFEYHSTTMGNEPVEQIFFSGTICTNKLILQYMYSQLGIESLILDPLAPDNPHVGRVQGPPTATERMEYNLVTALAISDNSITPNLLFTYAAKERLRSALGVDKAIYAVTVFILLVLTGVWYWQQGSIQGSKAQYALLAGQMQAYKPPATEAMLMDMAARVDEMHLNLKKASLRYESLAILSELSGLTPHYVKLMSVQMELGPYVEVRPAEVPDPKAKPAPPKPPARRGEEKASPKLVIMDGFIEGRDVDKFESAFVSYLIRLENSQLFTMPQIHKQELEEFPNRGTVLRFIIHIPVV